MPFDAAPVVRSPLPDSIAGQSALVLDMMEFYFRDGERWAHGGWRRAGDKRCLLDAVRFVRSEIRCKHDRAEYYLARAIDAERATADPSLKPLSIALVRDAIVMKFNDAEGRTYSDIAALLRKAKELAEADARTCSHVENEWQRVSGAGELVTA